MKGHGGTRVSEGIGDGAPESDAERSALGTTPRGGILGRALRNQQMWLTVGYFAVLLLLARVYA